MLNVYGIVLSDENESFEIAAESLIQAVNWCFLTYKEKPSHIEKTGSVEEEDLEEIGLQDARYM